MSSDSAPVSAPAQAQKPTPTKKTLDRDALFRTVFDEIKKNISLIKGEPLVQENYHTLIEWLSKIPYESLTQTLASKLKALKIDALMKQVTNDDQKNELCFHLAMINKKIGEKGFDSAMVWFCKITYPYDKALRELIDLVSKNFDLLKDNITLKEFIENNQALLPPEVISALKFGKTVHTDLSLAKNEVNTLKTKALDESDTDALKTLLSYLKQNDFPALAEVYEALGEISVRARLKNPEWYVQVREFFTEKAEAYFQYARDYYEGYYKAKGVRRQGIYYDLAVRCYQGKLFRKNDFLARQLLEEGYAQNDLDAEGLILLASMYFWGIGGLESYKQVGAIFNKLYEEGKIEKNKEALYLLGEYSYLVYYDAKIDKDYNLANSYKSMAKMLFEEAAKLDHEKAVVCLEILSAEPLLVEEEVQDVEEVEEVLVVSELRAPDGQQTVPPKGKEEISSDDTKAEKNSNDEKEGDVTEGSIDGEGNDSIFKDPPTDEEQDQPSAQMEEVSVDEPLDTEKTNQIGNILTKLCLQLRINETQPDTPHILELKAQLIKLDERFQSGVDFFAELKKLETDQGTYFDSDVSSDSDSDREKAYHKNDFVLSAHKQEANSLIAQITENTEKFLSKLEGKGNKKTGATEFDESDVKSSYVSVLKKSSAAENVSTESMCDLETVVDFAARGELDKALCQIDSLFYGAQTRGVHYFVDQWSQGKRRAFRKKIYAEGHPLLGKPIYSSAVLELAGVNDPFPEDEKDKIKLEQAARCIAYRLSKLKNEEPHADLSAIAFGKQNSITIRNYDNRLMQVQQLYTVDYDMFLGKYLEWELTQTPHFFATQKMHFVSTADLQSKHSGEYGIGNKVYDSRKEYRLRPRYNSALRAIRPHSGAVYLTLHPLEDYLPERHNHIPSLGVKGKITLDKRIVPERECTFFGHIPKERLVHVEAMRFPSFHHNRYLDVMRLRYGLTPDLYNRFKLLLKNSKPHTTQNRLTILLLGEHIVVYKILMLQKRAEELVQERGTEEYWDELYGRTEFEKRKAEKKNAKLDGQELTEIEMKEIRGNVEQDKAVIQAMKENRTTQSALVYRTPMGNFSFFSDQPYTATPNNKDASGRLKRLQSAVLRKEAHQKEVLKK